ncbi:hypothetical protein [Micromonospora sp. NPDC002575]|uniref:hypothetical protein n=1 Tax=Micromonospora sp. NPDC002575 TaxID=3364222 RepID=UPI0036CCED89
MIDFHHRNVCSTCGDNGCPRISEARNTLESWREGGPAVQAGDVLHLTRAASVKFIKSIAFRLIKVGTTCTPTTAGFGSTATNRTSEAKPYPAASRTSHGKASG